VKRKKREPDEEEEVPVGWWKKDYVPPPPKKTVFSKLRSRFHKINLKNRTPSWTPGRPTFLTFKCIVALVLIFMYLMVAANAVTSSPFILILIAPTIWLLVDYIKRNWRKEGSEKT